MDLLDLFIEGQIALSMKESSKQDISELSKLIDRKYPNASIRQSHSYFYPTLESFYNQYGKSHEVCFYNKVVKSYDGYMHLESSRFTRENFFTASEIIFEHTEKNIEEIKEDEVVKIFYE